MTRITVLWMVMVAPVALLAQLTDREIFYKRMSGKLLQSYSPEEHAWRRNQHRLFRETRTVKPLNRSVTKEYSGSRPWKLAKAARSGEGFTRLLVIADENLYRNEEAQTVIDRYVQDIIRGYGCPVVLEVVDGGTAPEIKEMVKEYYDDGGLDGFVTIGQVTAPWYYIPNDHYWWENGYGPVDFTCDLYYMDLDGEWIDDDDDGRFEDHQDGAGDKAPEIFTGRIDPNTMREYGSEEELLVEYMDKNHRYWTGETEINHTGVTFVDHDWVPPGDDMANLYSRDNVELIGWTRNDNCYTPDYYLNTVLQSPHGFIFQWSHAGNTSHYFHVGGDVSYNDIYNVDPKPLGYNIDGCSAADWAASRGAFLCGAYIYNKSLTALSLISTTKTGGMLEFGPFYESLGKNNCMGVGFKDWMEDMITTYRGDYGYVIGWHYGMTIVGDPLIAFREVPISNITDIKPISTKDPDGYNFEVAGSRVYFQVPVVSGAEQPRVVNIDMYNLRGSKLGTLFNGMKEAGSHTITISNAVLSSGLYVCTMQAGAFSGKVLLKKL